MTITTLLVLKCLFTSPTATLAPSDSLDTPLYHAPVGVLVDITTYDWPAGWATQLTADPGGTYLVLSWSGTLPLRSYYFALYDAAGHCRYVTAQAVNQASVPIDCRALPVGRYYLRIGFAPDSYEVSIPFRIESFL